MLGLAVMSEAIDHVTIIEPTRGWPAPRWRELWEYRDLLRMLVARDFSSRYRQTLLGPLWFIVQPLLTMLMFMLVFRNIAGISTEGVPAPLFYLCGLLGWSYFAQTITAGGLTFINNSHLFSKVYFPRIVVPAAGAVSNLFATVLQLIPVAIFYAWFAWHGADLHPGWSGLLLVPAAMLQLVILALAVSLWMSAASAKYRDLVHLNQFLVQLWMFATPVFYPMSYVSERWQWLLWCNPVAAPVEMLRLGLLGCGTLNPLAEAASAAATLILFFSGWMFFGRAERTVTDSA
jgi:lipopolysaccharide transport system permease protein